MTRPATPPPRGRRADAVDQREVHDLWDHAWRGDLPGAGSNGAVTAPRPAPWRLRAREETQEGVLSLAVQEEGRVVSAGQLRVDGATAAVESLTTDPAARGHGHGDAVLAAALDQAAGFGCDLVVLEAGAADWPRHWYARRGFVPVGSTWDVVRPPTGSRRERASGGG